MNGVILLEKECVMTYLSDLHIHSSASDGQYTPARLVQMAKERGLEAIALTDHDTIDGLDAAARVGEALGVLVLQGVELGAKEHRNLHILGYNFDPSGLIQICNRLKAGREERKYHLADFLREKGIDIPLQEVEALAGDGNVGRPHFAQVMVRHGYVATNREAFDRYLDTDEYKRIEPFRFDARTCVESIKAAGGKVSLAHPYQLGYADERLEDLVRKLKEYGLDAIECYYPRHTERQTSFYLKLAEKYGLHITGGSDFHGEKVKPDIQLAALKLDLDWFL